MLSDINSVLCTWRFVLCSLVQLASLKFSKHQVQSTKLAFLREYPAHARRFRHAVDCQDVSARAHVSAIALRRLVHFVEGVPHRVFQRLVNARLSPEKRV